MKILFCTLILICIQVMAKDVKCIVANSTNSANQLVGGVIQFTPENGNLTWFKDELTISITNDSEVSQFKAQRSNCNYGIQHLVSGQELLALWSEFNSCMHQQNNQIGYVTTTFSADFRSKNGRYSEIFATASGPIPYMQLELSDCKIIE